MHILNRMGIFKMKTTLKKLSQKELHNLIGSTVILTENHTTISGDRVLKKKDLKGYWLIIKCFGARPPSNLAKEITKLAWTLFSF